MTHMTIRKIGNLFCSERGFYRFHFVGGMLTPPGFSYHIIDDVMIHEISGNKPL